MPYYIGDVIKNQNNLIARTPEEFHKTGIDVLLRTRAEEIDADRRIIRLSGGESMPYDYLVIATGASPVRPEVPGQELENVFCLRSLSDAVRMKTLLLTKPFRHVVVLGAGFISLEMSEAFQTLGMKVLIVHRDDLPVKRWDADLASRILETFKDKGIEFLSNTKVDKIEPKQDGGLRLMTNRGDIDTDLVLIAIGIRPNTLLAKQLPLQLGEYEAIHVNDAQQTSIERIYATGDCCDVYHRVANRWVYFPLGDVANKQGRVAGRTIGGESTSMPGIVGAQSFKFFDLELAATGLSESEAVRYGFQPVSAVAWAPPTARAMLNKEDGETGLKIIGDRASGRLLGAQAIGKKRAVHKIDVLSAALWYGARVDEISNLDLAYSPPFGGPWDLIHVTARLLMKKL